MACTGPGRAWGFNEKGKDMSANTEGISRSRKRVVVFAVLLSMLCAATGARIYAVTHPGCEPGAEKSVVAHGIVVCTMTVTLTH